MKFTKGQRVRVEFEGAVSLTVDNHLHHVYVLPDGSPDNSWVPVKHITPLDPANWPPQLGDIWELDGEEYFARKHRISNDKVILVKISGHGDYTSLDTFRASGPTLVRRRGV